MDEAQEILELGPAPGEGANDSAVNTRPQLLNPLMRKITWNVQRIGDAHVG
jgi:hypothetical protein